MLTVREPLASSPLLGYHGGCAVFAGLPDPATFQQLRDEAMAALPSSNLQVNWEVDSAEGRGGTPRRRMRSASGGEAQDAFYLAPWLSELLGSICGNPVVPTGSRGSYNYYLEAGDFLDLHRDIVTCDVALITSLHETETASVADGAIITYPGSRDRPLSAIRSTPAEGAHVVKLLPGQSVILLGGIVPHYIAPMAPGQVRITSVLCFCAIS